MDAPRVVHVVLHGQPYAVRSDLDPAYVIELATYVDERMRQAATSVPSADTLQLAVLTALNLADELFRLREAGAGVEGTVHERTARIERLVDAVLERAARPAIAAGG